LDGFNAKQILLMLGTNNLHLNSDDEILSGLDLLIKTMKNRQPHSKMLVIGILPRRDYEERVKNLNYRLAQIAGLNEVSYTNIGDVLLQSDGKIDESLFTDGLHPNAAGYNKLAEVIKPHLIQKSR
jgi:lysophospholipase L1-like esterase